MLLMRTRPTPILLKIVVAKKKFVREKSKRLSPLIKIVYLPLKRLLPNMNTLDFGWPGMSFFNKNLLRKTKKRESGDTTIKSSSLL